MSFINKIEKVISEAVEEYNLQLSDKYGLDPCELDELWASVMNSSVKNKTVTNPTPKVVSKPKPTPTALATSPALSENVPVAGSSDPLLPEAGGRSTRLHLGAAMIIVSLFILVVIGRRVR